MLKSLEEAVSAFKTESWVSNRGKMQDLLIGSLA